MSIAQLIVPGLHPRRPDATTDAGRWTSTWTAWGTTASVTVTDPAALPAARRLVGRQFAAAEKAAARRRPDAELHRLYRAGGRPITVSPLLAELISAALVAAERTDGDVDPTVAAAVTAVQGSARRLPDGGALPVCGSRPTVGRPVPGWHQVELDGCRLRVPPGITLDLSATATAFSCDLAAAKVRDRLRVGALVRLGRDAATAGPGPTDGWPVPIGDRIGDRSTEVLLSSGSAFATSYFTTSAASSTQFVDPRTGRAPVEVWRMASAIAFSSLEASTYAATALVRGLPARSWLSQLWVPARLVTAHDDVITIGPWQSHERRPASDN
jgi:FAD:protein FMN transferase